MRWWVGYCEADHMRLTHLHLTDILTWPTDLTYLPDLRSWPTYMTWHAYPIYWHGPLIYSPDLHLGFLSLVKQPSCDIIVTQAIGTIPKDNRDLHDKLFLHHWSKCHLGDFFPFSNDKLSSWQLFSLHHWKYPISQPVTTKMSLGWCFFDQWWQITLNIWQCYTDSIVSCIHKHILYTTLCPNWHNTALHQHRNVLLKIAEHWNGTVVTTLSSMATHNSHETTCAIIPAMTNMPP